MFPESKIFPKIGREKGGRGHKWAKKGFWGLDYVRNRFPMSKT